MSADQVFWLRKTLDQLSPEEWESLCDGCAKCCLHKLEDEDTGDVYYTEVVCRYLDDQCRCSCYQERNVKVPNCVWLKPDDIAEFHWLPSTCAYRLMAEGLPLPEWHPLVSGDPQSVHRAGQSMRGRGISDALVDEADYEDHIIRWID